MFDSFCAAYYRFVPDDELRTAMYNKKPSQMKKRLHEMRISNRFHSGIQIKILQGNESTPLHML